MGSCVSLPDYEDTREASPLGSFFTLPEPASHGSLQPVRRAERAKSEEQPRTPTMQTNPGGASPERNSSQLAPRPSAQAQNLLVSANSDLSPSRRSMYEHFFESQLLGLTSLQEELLLLKDLRLFALLGRGGFAATFLGSWREGVPVAAKLILASPQQLQQLQQQQQHGQHSTHPRLTPQQQARELLLSKLQRPGFAISTHPAVTHEDVALLSSDMHPPRTSTEGLETSLLDSSLPSSALTEALLCKHLSHPNIVTTFTVRCASISAPFLAAARYGHLPRPLLTQKLQGMWQALSPSQQLGAAELEHLVDQVLDLVANWHGCTPLHPPKRDTDLRRSSSSHDGFGNPNEARDPLSWQEVLQQVGGKAGDLITVLVMRYCDLGTLETAILRGVFQGAGDHAVVQSATSQQAVHDLYTAPQAARRRPLSTPLPATGADSTALGSSEVSLDPSLGAAGPGTGSPSYSAQNGIPAEDSRHGSAAQDSRPASTVPTSQEQEVTPQQAEAGTSQRPGSGPGSAQAGPRGHVSDSLASSSHANSEQSVAAVQVVKDRRQRLRAVLRTAREVAQALEHLHEWNVVHGDLKPANVLLASSRQDARGFTALVADFGLSMLVGSSPEVLHNNQGTIQYMAPEMLRAPGRISPAADIYALGITLWTMLTARCPYEGIPNEQVVLGVTQHGLRPRWPTRALPALEQLYLRCVAHNPADRPSAAVLVRLLSQLEADVRKEPGSRSHRRTSSGLDSSTTLPSVASASTVGAAASKRPDPWLQSLQSSQDYEQMRMKQQQVAAAARLRAFAMSAGLAGPAGSMLHAAQATPAILRTAAGSVPVTPIRPMAARQQQQTKGSWFPRTDPAGMVQTPQGLLAKRGLDMHPGNRAPGPQEGGVAAGTGGSAASAHVPGDTFLQGSPQQPLQAAQVPQGLVLAELPALSQAPGVGASIVLQQPSDAQVVQAAQSPQAAQPVVQAAQSLQAVQHAQFLQAAQQQQLAHQLAQHQQLLQQQYAQQQLSQQQVAQERLAQQQQQQAALLPQLLLQRSQQEAERRVQQLVVGLSRSSAAAAASTTSHLLIADAVQRMQQQRQGQQVFVHQDMQAQQPVNSMHGLPYPLLAQAQQQEQQQQQAVFADLLQRVGAGASVALSPVQEETPSSGMAQQSSTNNPFARHSSFMEPLTLQALATGETAPEPMLPDPLGSGEGQVPLEQVISLGRQPVPLTPVASEGSRASLPPVNSGGQQYVPSNLGGRQSPLEPLSSGGRSMVVLEPVTSGDYQSLAPETVLAGLEPRVSQQAGFSEQYIATDTSHAVPLGFFPLEPATSGASEIQVHHTRSVTITPLIIPPGMATGMVSHSVTSPGLSVTSPGLSVTSPGLTSPSMVSPDTISPSVGPHSMMSSTAITASSMARSGAPSLHSTQQNIKPWDLSRQSSHTLPPQPPQQQPQVLPQRQRQQQRERELAHHMQQMQVNFPGSWGASPPVSSHEVLAQAPQRSDTAFALGQNWQPHRSDTFTSIDSGHTRRYEPSTSMGSTGARRMDTAASMDNLRHRRFDTSASMDRPGPRRLATSGSLNTTGPRQYQASTSMGSTGARRLDTSISLGSTGPRRVDTSTSMDSQGPRRLNTSTSIGSTGAGPRRLDTSTSVGSSRSRQLQTAESMDSNYPQSFPASMSLERLQPRRLDTAASFEAVRPVKADPTPPGGAPPQVVSHAMPAAEQP